jgi:hypothetical protein
MTHKTSRRSRRRAFLLVAVVVALATAGLVYAHRTETLTVDAQVATGRAEMRINNAPASTDDDHVSNTWETVKETVAQEGTDYDRWPGTSSNDPSSPLGGTRYTKDVARCRVTGSSNTTVTVLVDNAYPSYWCTIRADQGLRNAGTVPMKDQALRVEVCEADCGNPANWVAATYSGDRFWYDGDGDTYPELQFANRYQNWCGRQWDPSPTSLFGWQVWFHVEQDAAQGVTYLVRYSFEFVNWNEWSLDNCEGYDEWGNGSGTQKFPIP